ncbi:MAG: DUF2511 domain-containing protein [Candidatus Nanopelagicales bacterium]
MRKVTIIIGTALLGVGLTACGGSSASGSSTKEVTKADFGAAWPLTVDGGTLACNGSGGVGVVTITVDGTVYALNGTAKGQKAGIDIAPIWAADPDIQGAKKNIGVLIDEGLKLCV